jgi:Family of unknown function (DUF5691)
VSWDELVAAALIGTDRRPVAGGVPDGSPPGLEGALEARGVEDRLLGAAAAWTVARRAGAIAGAPVAVEPVEEDPRPIAPATALRQRLDGHYPQLLPEWLALAAERGLLEPTFADETWEDRAAFVAALATGLSDADEPLLERALDDRRKPVRDAAAHLLAGLPRSRFGARMAERAAPLLRVEGGRVRGKRLVVELPGDPDAAAKRDGVPTGGRRSERLHFLLLATPLVTWDLDMVSLDVADDLGEVVHRGWADAAVAQRDAEWARTLWAVRPDPVLLAALPHQEAQQLAARAERPDVVAAAVPGPWGATLTIAVLNALQRHRTGLDWGQDAAFAAERLSPAFTEDAEEKLRDLPGRDIRRLLDVLSARAAMLRELS